MPSISSKKTTNFQFEGIIYNRKELDPKAKTDPELVLSMLKNNIDLNRLDGEYAFAYKNNNKIILARDILGIRPLFYCSQDGFSFCSEKKELEKLGFIDINELDPRHILIYKDNKIEFIKRPFFTSRPTKDTKESIEKQLKELIKKAIKKRTGKNIGILFSGGIDSTLIALILKQLNIDFTCYTAVLEEKEMSAAEDLKWAEKIAKHYNFKLKTIKIRLKDVEKYIKKIIPLIEDPSAIKTGVALPIYIACEAAKKDNIKTIFSGLGSEEIFAGYERHKQSKDINKECINGLKQMHERDLYRDYMITKGLELKTPFLDNELIRYALNIPEKYKTPQPKQILRDTAIRLKLKKEFAQRKKAAAQYGSKFDRAITKLTKKNNLKYKADYLRQFYKNINLAALTSTGKDSIYALYLMKKHNYNVKCLINIKSNNPDSFMFHTPNIDLIKLQAESINLPLIQETTEGEKELELKDLAKSLLKAKQQHNIQGIITGALYSNYQRERIENIAKKLNLKVFSPLWHIDQETELRELINNNFEVIITSIAADGLDKNILGKKIDNNLITFLSRLNKKNNINIAGEGGEYETLVLNCPLFKKRITIKQAKTVMENQYTGYYKIIKAEKT